MEEENKDFIKTNKITEYYLLICEFIYEYEEIIGIFETIDLCEENLLNFLKETDRYYDYAKILKLDLNKINFNENLIREIRIIESKTNEGKIKLRVEGLAKIIQVIK